MTQNPVPAPETTDTAAGEEETIGKSGNPAADTHGASESRAMNKAPAPESGAADKDAEENEPGAAVEDMDLSPLGLKDAPAQDENEHSLVDPGNS
jgi:antitoxin (DNA-binding transcriptional repressor) of toxin-antitoxin stability system